MRLTFFIQNVVQHFLIICVALTVLSNDQNSQTNTTQNSLEPLLYYQNNSIIPLNLSSLNSQEILKDFNKREGEKRYEVIPLIVPKTQKIDFTKKLVPSPDTSLNLNAVLDNFGSNITMEYDPVQKNIGSKNGDLAFAFGTAENKSSDFFQHFNKRNEIDDEGSDSRMIHNILLNIQELIEQRRQLGSTEGLLCSMNGTWLSEAGGVVLGINYKNNNRKKFRINLSDRLPPSDKGFLCAGKWIVFGEMPFRHSGLVIVLAVHPADKHIATFIGECRTCEGNESVTGTWLIGRASRDCRDQKAAHMVLSDVWLKESAHALQKEHLQKMRITKP